MKNRPEFTREQEDWIFYQIDKWFLIWKDKIVAGAEFHNLEVAKEILKQELCQNMKDHWVIPDSDSVSVVENKESIYPVHLICNGHKRIEEMEITQENYIKVKINGKWHMIYLPSI